MRLNENNSSISVKSQTAILLASRLLASAIQGVTLILMARWLGPRDLGIASSVIGVAFLLFVISDFGLTTSLSKWMARREYAKVAGGLKLNVISTLVSAFVGCITIYLAATFLGWPISLAIIIIAMAVEKNIEATMSIPIAAGERYQPAVSIILRRVVTLTTFILLFLLTERGIFAYGSAFTIGSLAGLAHMQRVRRLLLRLTPPAPLTAVARESLPFLVTNIGAQSRQLDVPIVTLLLGPAAAGLYASAQKITGPFAVIPSTLAQVLLPHSVTLDPIRVRQLIGKLVVLTIGMFVLILCIIPFLETPFLWLVGSQYQESMGALYWSLLAMPFIGIASPLGSVLQGQNQERFVAINGILFGVLTLIFVAAAAILWGPTGAAAGVFASFLIKCIFLILKVIKL